MNLMRYSHSKGTRLFQTILWNIEQKRAQKAAFDRFSDQSQRDDTDQCCDDDHNRNINVNIILHCSDPP